MYEKGRRITVRGSLILELPLPIVYVRVFNMVLRTFSGSQQVNARDEEYRCRLEPGSCIRWVPLLVFLHFRYSQRLNRVTSG